MIPYDDLVAALQQWRARQGLPVSTLGGGGVSAAPQTGSGPYGQPGSGPYGQPGSGPTRGAPPAPPRGKQPSIPPPLAASEETMHEVDDAEMLEEQYENEGADFAMGFGGQHQNEDETSLSDEPSGGNSGGYAGGGRGGRDDW
jgi:hypothetical protein